MEASDARTLVGQVFVPRDTFTHTFKSFFQLILTVFVAPRGFDCRCYYQWIHSELSARGRKRNYCTTEVLSEAC